MSFDRFLLRAALAALVLAAAPAARSQSLEIISLRHATVEQALPALRPFLEPGGTLTGQAGQIIVRASPGNVAELRRILESIDRPARQLLISVRFDAVSGLSKESMGAGAAVGNGEARIDLHAEADRGQSSERVDQQLRVLEGGRAFIATGQSRPLVQRQIIQTPIGPVAQDTMVVQEAASGFEVVPRLAGERVELDIAPQRERFVDAPVPGAIESQRAFATVSARLGEWVEIGGAVSASSREDRGLGFEGRSSGSQARRIWVRVEELP